MKYRFKKQTSLVLVEKPLIGQLYHVAWANSHGVVGRCIEIFENLKLVRLETPKTKIAFKKCVNFSDLRHTRKNQIKNRH